MAEAIPEIDVRVAEAKTRARAALDELIGPHAALGLVREEEMEVSEGAPDPAQTFAGLEDVMAFIQTKAEHDRLLAGVRRRCEEAEARFRTACERCRFVPERAALYHDHDGTRYLVRREQPKTSYSRGADTDGGMPETSSEEEGGEVEVPAIFAVSYQGTVRAGEAAQSESRSTLQTRRRVRGREARGVPAQSRGGESQGQGGFVKNGLVRGAGREERGRGGSKPETLGSSVGHERRRAILLALVRGRRRRISARKAGPASGRGPVLPALGSVAVGLVRTVSPYRLNVQMGAEKFIPSLDHLSSGQANLFNLFATVIRSADRGDLRKSYQPQEIEGLVVIDEIEAQAHSDLQYEVVPKLLKLFPKVQFTLTSHSPLFLLGMEKEYGSEGFQIVDMPGGQTITTERFSEFKRSLEYYRRTAAYEQGLEESLQAGPKPLVLTEGETDPKYIHAALELLERRDLLEAVDIEWVGTQGQQGPLNTGQKGLDHTKNVLAANPDLTNRRVLLLYDSDTNKPIENTGPVSASALPKSEANAKVKRGIENLLPVALFEPRFYPPKEIVTDYGERKTIEEFDKTNFCRWVCDERRQADDFAGFSPGVTIMEEFLANSGTSEEVTSP